MPSREKPAATKLRYPTYSAWWVFQCFHNPLNSNMGHGIFNVHTDVNACDCIRGCTGTVKESALKVDFGRKIPCRTVESNLRRRRAGPMLYQPSYIPTPSCVFFLFVFFFNYGYSFFLACDDLGEKSFDESVAVCSFIFLGGDQLAHTSKFHSLSQVSPRWLSELRRLWSSVYRRVVRVFFSLKGSDTIPRTLYVLD